MIAFAVVYAFIAISALMVAFCESGVTAWAALAGAVWLIVMGELIHKGHA